MNTVDAIGASAQNAGSGINGLSSDEFFQLIFAELSNQDPLDPNDTNALLEQIANIRSIESDIDLVDKLSELVGQNELASGAGLIGRLVSGLSEANERVTGIVNSVSKTEHGVVLNLDGGLRVPMADLDRVLDGGQNTDSDSDSDGESDS